MKKVMLGLVMVMMLMSLVGCGETKEDGFIPEQTTESEVVTNDEKEELEKVIDTENLQKYYDVEKYLGSPRLAVCKVEVFVNGSVYTSIREIDDKTYFLTPQFATNEVFVEGQSYYCILCDNNTTEDNRDDVVAYIFTTPIE